MYSCVWVGVCDAVDTGWHTLINKLYLSTTYRVFPRGPPRPGEERAGGEEVQGHEEGDEAAHLII